MQKYNNFLKFQFNVNFFKIYRTTSRGLATVEDLVSQMYRFKTDPPRRNKTNFNPDSYREPKTPPEPERANRRSNCAKQLLN
jgi:hypothetical protein